MARIVNEREREREREREIKSVFYLQQRSGVSTSTDKSTIKGLGNIERVIFVSQAFKI